MEYNTQREKLIITDYGRSVSKLIKVAATIPDRDTRNKAAAAIITAMQIVNPEVRESEELDHILWDHLMIMADGCLDVDDPYPLPAESLKFEPSHLAYHVDMPKFPHYGRHLQTMIERVSKMEESEERTELVHLILQQMKFSYIVWNSPAVDDETIATHLFLLSGGAMKMEENYEIEVSDDKVRQMQTEQKAKKKKKH